MTENPTIGNHEAFNNFVSEGLRVGVHAVGNKGTGKTRLFFCAVQELMKQPNVRCIVFDGSETWLYSFSKIPVFNVSEKDILAVNRRQADTIEKYSLENWNLVKLALETYPSILFRLKSRNPQKRGFFCRTVINFLDQLQRDEKATTENHETTKAYAIVLEESQNIFPSNNSTASSECGTFMTVFSEGRNQRIGFFSNSQRLTDMSKTVRAKQFFCIGRLNPEDITPQLRKLEKLHGLDFANMNPRQWLFEGQIFTSPEFKQQGKPYIINQEIKQKWLSSLPKPKNLREKILAWFNTAKAKPNPLRPTQSQTLAQMEKEDEEDEKELNDSDGLMALDDEDILFPE